MALPAYTGISFTKTLHSSIPDNLFPSKYSLPSPFVACITGSSRGIGAATAIAFAQAGATGLVLTARKVESLYDTRDKCLAAAKAKDLQIECLTAEAGADEEVVKHIASTIKTKFGRLDILINNAGILSTDAGAFNKVQDIPLSQIQIPTEVNYLGRFLTIKHLIPLLLESPNGSKAIVNVSSIGSHLTGGGALGFGISALSTNRLTEWVAGTYQDTGLVAYAIHPGAVLSSGAPGLPDWVAEMSKDDAALMSALILWLLEGDKTWLSGRYLSANWDFEELESRKEEIVKGDKLKMRMVI